MSKNSFDSKLKKRVSYILVTKNKANFLDTALNDYRKLIKPVDELIVIDGASTDSTKSIINKYKDLIDVYISEPDLNPSHAFNKGILLANGKYIKNINDDDTVYPESMEKAVRVLDKHREVDVLLCGGTKQHGKTYSVFYIPNGVNYGLSIEDPLRYGACGVGLIIRRSSVAKGLLVPVEMASDLAYITSCIAAGMNVKFCRINLFNHPIYPHSVVIAKSKEHEKNADDILFKMLPRASYLKYRIHYFLRILPRITDKLYKKSSISQRLMTPARLALRVLNKNRSREAIDYSNLKTIVSNYKWDAGFS